MSQRSEKYARDLIRRMDALEARQLDSDTYAALLRTVQEQSERMHSRWSSRARQAEREARTWRLNAYLTLILLFLVACVLLVVNAKAEQTTTEQPTEISAEPVVAILGSPEEPEEPENERIEAALLDKAHVIEDVTVTHYCICEACCGKAPDHPAYGITASGLRATPGVSVAVDPDVIPLGSDVLVDYGDGEIHYYRADDTGSGVKGNHIDLCMASHQEALEAGVREATVYWVAP